MSAITNLLDWFKDNIKRISTRALESIARIVYTIPLAEDWQMSEAVTSWTCPEGQYEVFVLLDTNQFLELNGSLRYIAFNVTGYLMWYPFSYVGSYLAVEWTQAGAVFTATGLASYPDSGITASEGWKLSKGDILTELNDSSFFVRFRRVA